MSLFDKSTGLTGKAALDLNLHPVPVQIVSEVKSPGERLILSYLGRRIFIACQLVS